MAVEGEAGVPPVRLPRRRRRVQGEAGVPPVRLPCRRRRVRLDSTTLLGLPLAWLVVFFVVPIAIVAAYSFGVYSLYPGKHRFTLAAWRAFAHSHSSQPPASRC